MNKSMRRSLLFDRSRLELRHLAERGHDMTSEQLLRLARPKSSFQRPEFDELLQAILAARQADRLVVVMMGGLPIKLGKSWFLVDLIKRGVITHVATNGAAVIHDFELAIAGGTSENVASEVKCDVATLPSDRGSVKQILIQPSIRAFSST